MKHKKAARPKKATLHDFNFELSTESRSLIQCVTITAETLRGALSQLPLTYAVLHSKVRSSRFGDGLFHPLVTASRIEAGVLQREAADNGGAP